MDNVCTILLTREDIGDKTVEIVIECENGYNPYVLCNFSVKVIKRAEACGGKMAIWTKEPQLEKFCHSFTFETEEGKKDFFQNPI